MSIAPPSIGDGAPLLHGDGARRVLLVARAQPLAPRRVLLAVLAPRVLLVLLAVWRLGCCWCCLRLEMHAEQLACLRRELRAEPLFYRREQKCLRSQPSQWSRCRSSTSVICSSIHALVMTLAAQALQ